MLAIHCARPAAQIDASSAGVVFSLLPNGLRSGEGYVRFINANDAQLALVCASLRNYCRRVRC